MSQISRNRNEQGNIKTDGKEIQKTVREKFKNLYSIKLENLKEVDGFLDSAKLPKLKQEDVIKLNRPITNVAIRIVVKAFKAKNSQRQIIAGFKQTFEEIYIQTFLSHKKKKTGSETEGVFSNTFYEVSITVRQKPSKATKKKYMLGSLMNIHSKQLNKINAEPKMLKIIKHMSKILTIMRKLTLSLKCRVVVQHTKVKIYM